MPSLFRNISKYWLFQFMGWGIFIAINLFFAFSYGLFDEQFISRLILYVLIGILMTHVMRLVIHQVRLLGMTVNLQLIGFLILSFLFAVGVGISETYLSQLANMEYKDELRLNQMQKISGNVFTSFVYLFIWNCIYFIYHYVEESRKNQLDNLKLEALVKSLELKTIKSHINPHFIFNALNSIRALIDEDPTRARQAVTALGNMLRSSMQSDQMETITLEKELDIVKDYLALELIRFEDRLHVGYEIEEDALDDPIPPMMLQTLVENAIKHGIGKMVDPGEIRILAREKEGFLLLSVINTGKLEMKSGNEGFGLHSTANRLDLIFGKKASFSIRQYNDTHVEALVAIPLN